MPVKAALPDQLNCSVEGVQSGEGAEIQAVTEAPDESARLAKFTVGLAVPRKVSIFILEHFFAPAVEDDEAHGGDFFPGDFEKLIESVAVGREGCRNKQVTDIVLYKYFHLIAGCATGIADGNAISTGLSSHDDTVAAAGAPGIG